VSFFGGIARLAWADNSKSSACGRARPAMVSYHGSAEGSIPIGEPNARKAKTSRVFDRSLNCDSPMRG